MNLRLLASLLALAAVVGCAKENAPAAAAPTTTHEVRDFPADVLARSESTPVLVDFWAPWCGPCRMLSPVIEKAAADASGRWTLVTVNVDNNEPLAREYGIQSIPNVKLFHRGKVIAEFVGAKSESGLRDWLDTHLPKQ
ncbi:MAG TPA: thioredoxin [Opitutaceae bacterium]|nr:thioredoxin [Opitutaceae bacterium]